MPVIIVDRIFVLALGAFSKLYFVRSADSIRIFHYFSINSAFTGFSGEKGGLVFSIPGLPALLSLPGNVVRTVPFDLRFFYGLSAIRTFFSLFRALHRGSIRPYFVKFFMKGVGYRVWTLKGKAFLFRLGFTHRLIFYLPPYIFFRRRKYKFVLLSYDKARLAQVSKYLLSLRVPDVYKGKGIRYLGDKVFVKSRLKDAKKR